MSEDAQVAKLKQDVEARDRIINSLQHHVSELAGEASKASALADENRGLKAKLAAAETALHQARTEASTHAGTAAGLVAQRDADAAKVAAAAQIAAGIKALLG
jgi:chromosome segregation ATPase